MRRLWTLVLVAALAGSVHAQSPNLLVNADAEIGEGTTSGYDTTTIPGWSVTGGLPTVIAYGVSGFPDAGSPGSPTRGGNFFAGGAGGKSKLEQTVDLSAAAAAIDTGTVTFAVSGWLGGYASQNDKAGAQVTFRDASGRPRRRARLRPVSAAQRGRTTGFVLRTTTGTVPAGTRTAAVELQMLGHQGYNDGYLDDLSLTLSVALPAPPPPTPPVATVPAFDHVFLIVLENKNYGTIIGNTAQAPYLNSLLPSAALATNYYALVHPSDPNYVALASGSVHGLTDNSVHTTTISAPHLGDRLEAAGRTWTGYAEDMNGPCDTTDHGYFYVDNLPFYFFENIRTDVPRCQAHLRPLTQLLGTDLQSAATTPHFVWIEPNIIHLMHDGTVQDGDGWLSTTLPILFASPAWQTERSLLVITWDEDDFTPVQRVATIVLGSTSVRAGYESPVRYTHYSLLRTIEAALGLPVFTANDRYAEPMNDLWN